MIILLMVILVLTVFNTIILINPSIKSWIYEKRMAKYNKIQKQIMDTRLGSNRALLERLKRVKYTRTFPKESIFDIIKNKYFDWV